MGHHLTERGTFKSDKYDWCPEGYFALKIADPESQHAVLVHAQLTTDKGLATDLREAVENAREAARLMELRGLAEQAYEAARTADPLRGYSAAVDVVMEAMRAYRTKGTR